jgi:recombinational DNA repair protein (RecF pathway)
MIQRDLFKTPKKQICDRCGRETDELVSCLEGRLCFHCWYGEEKQDEPRKKERVQS